MNCIKDGEQAARHLIRINGRANSEANAIASDWYEVILCSVEGTLSIAINGFGSIVL